MRLLKILIGGVLTIFCSTTYANSFDLLAGYYDVRAKTNSSSGNSSNLGVYKLSYAYSLSPQVVLSAGYTLMMSNTLGGDLSFGFDLGSDYFFLTSSSKSISESENSSLEISPLWRPFAGLSFHQRQFQSVKSNYAGFGFNFGIEKDIHRDYDIKALLRYVNLAGPQNSTATEVVLLLGITYSLSN